MQLADNDTLGSVDDKLAAADHDGHVTEIHLFLNGLFLHQAQPNTERAAERQTQLAALQRRVARLAQLVLDVLQPISMIVTLDRKHFSQNGFQPRILAFTGIIVQLQKADIGVDLDLGEIRNLELRLQRPKRPHFGRCDDTGGRYCH